MKKLINILLILTLNTSPVFADDINLSFTNLDADDTQINDISGTSSDNVTITNNVTNDNIPINVSNINTDSGALTLTNTSGTVKVSSISTTTGAMTITNSGTIGEEFGFLTITPSTGLTQITNNAGATINGSIDISSASSSSFITNSGTINDNITFTTGQTLNFFGGTISGTISGGGNLNIGQDGAGAATITASNSIGNASSLNLITVNGGHTFDTSTNSTEISATNIVLESGSTMTVVTNSITGAINGDASGNGTIRYTGDHAISSEIGGTQSLAAVTVDDGVTLTVGEDIAATTTTIGGGTSGSLSLNSGTSITGNLVLGDNATATLNSSSGVTGTVGLSTGSTLNIKNGALTGAISTDVNSEGDITIDGTVSTAGNYGSSSLKLNSIAIGASDTLNAATNNNALFSDLVTIGSSGVLTLGTGAVTGTVQGLSDDDGTVNINGSQTLAGALGTSSNSLELVAIGGSATVNTGTNAIDTVSLTVADGATLTVANDITVLSNATVGGGTSGVLNVNSGKTLTGNVALAAGAQLGLTGSVTGSITGSTDGVGIVNLNKDLTLTSDFSTLANSIATLNVGAGQTLNTGTSDVFANTVSLGSGSILNLNTNGDVIGDAQGATNGDGTVNVVTSNALTVSDLGTTGNFLSSVSVAASQTLDANTKSIRTTNGVTLNSGSTLSLTTGAVVGGVKGATDGVGAVTINGVNTMGSNFGTSSNSLASITIADGQSLTTNSHDIDATDIILTGNSLFAISGSSATTIVGAIKGATDGTGTVNVNQDFTLQGSLGTTTNSLSSVIVAASKTLTANDQNIDAAIGGVSLANGSVLTLTTGVVTGNVVGASDGVGTVNLNGTSSLGGGLGGSSSNSLATIAISASGNATTNGHDLVATNITLASGAVLNVSSGTNIISPIDGTADGNGTVNYLAGTHTTTSAIGTTNDVLAVTVADGTTLTANTAISANTLTVGGGTSGIFNLNSSQTLTGNLVLGDSATATLNSSSTVSGTVGLSTGSTLNLKDGASTGAISTDVNSEGDITIDGTVVSGGNYGASGLALNSIAIGTSGTLNAATNNNALFSDLVTIDSNGALTLGTGAVTGTTQGLTDGVGTVNINGSQTLAGALGTSSNSLALVAIGDSATVNTGTNAIDTTSLTVSDGATLTVANDITATTATVGGGTSGILNINSGKTLTGNVVLNSGATSTLNSNSEVTGTISLVSSSSTLNINSGVSTGAITGASDGSGIISVSSNHSLTSDWGSTSSSIFSTRIADGVTLTLGNRNIDSNFISLGDGSTLLIGSGSIVGAITSDINASSATASFANTRTLTSDTIINPTGPLNISILDGVTLTANNDISGSVLTVGGGTSGALILGSSQTLTGALTLANNATATLNANSTITGTTSLGSSSTLNINSGVSTGAINGTAANQGTVNYLSSYNITSSNAVGATNAVSAITVADGATLDVDTSIAANTLTVGAGTSGALDLASSTTLTGNLVLGDNATATLNSSSTVSGTVGLSTGSTLNLKNGASTGAISTDTNNQGSVTIDGTVVAGGNYGASNLTLNSITIGASDTLDAATNNAAIFSTGVTIGSSGVLALGTGSVEGGIQGASNGVGTLNINDNHTLLREIGEGNALEVINVAANKTLNANFQDINAALGINLNSGSILTLATGRVTGGVQGVSTGNGTVNLNGDSTLAGSLGSAVRLGTVAVGSSATVNTGANVINTELLTVADGAALTVANDITVTANATIGDGTSGILSINSGKTLTGDVVLNSGAQLNLTGSVTGSITGLLDGSGIVNLNKDLTLASDFSTSLNSIATLNVAASQTLTTSGSDIYANTVSLGTGSTLALSTNGNVIGNVEGSTNGVGAVSVATSNTLAGNLGTSLKSLSSVTVADSQTLTVGSNEVHATNVTLGSGSTLSVGSGSINGAIDGSASGNGTLSYTASSTTNGNIGATNALSAVNVASGATLDAATNSNTIFANNVNLTTGATLNMGGNITGNVNILTGTLNFGNSARAITGNLVGGSGSTIDLGSATHTVSGSTTIGSGDTININIASASTAGRITTAGTLSLSAAVNLNITTSLSSISGETQDLTILSGGSGSSLNEITDSNIDLNSSGSNSSSSISYSTLVSGNDLVLRLTAIAPTTVSVPSFLGGSNTALGNAFSVAANADNAQGELATIQTFLTANSGNQALTETAVRSITPNDVGVYQNNRSTISSSITNIQTRLASVRSAPTSQTFKTVNIHGEEVEVDDRARYADAGNSGSDANYFSDLKNKNIWGQLLTNRAKQDAKNGSEGYNSKLFGFSFGGDTKLSKSLTVGIGATIANSQIDSSSSNKRTDVDSYQLIAYSEKMLSDKIFLNSFAGASFNKYSSRRTISIIGKVADAKYSGQSFFARFGASYVHKENELTILPEIATNLSYDRIGDYTESGAGTANLVIDNKNYSIMELEPSIQISRIYQTNNEFIEPSIKLAYAYNFANNPKASNANFIGQTSTFQNQAAKIERGTIRLNTGLSFYQEEKFTASINYTLEKRSSFKSNGAFVKFDWKF